MSYVYFEAFKYKNKPIIWVYDEKNNTYTCDYTLYEKDLRASTLSEHEKIQLNGSFTNRNEITINNDLATLVLPASSRLIPTTMPKSLHRSSSSQYPSKRNSSLPRTPLSNSNEKFGQPKSTAYDLESGVNGYFSSDLTLETYGKREQHPFTLEAICSSVRGSTLCYLTLMESNLSLLNNNFSRILNTYSWTQTNMLLASTPALCLSESLIKTLQQFFEHGLTDAFTQSKFKRDHAGDLIEFYRTAIVNLLTKEPHRTRNKGEVQQAKLTTAPYLYTKNYINKVNQMWLETLLSPFQFLIDDQIQAENLTDSSELQNKLRLLKTKLTTENRNNMSEFFQTLRRRLKSLAEIESIGAQLPEIKMDTGEILNLAQHYEPLFKICAKELEVSKSFTLLIDNLSKMKYLPLEAFVVKRLFKKGDPPDFIKQAAREISQSVLNLIRTENSGSASFITKNEKTLYLRTDLAEEILTELQIKTNATDTKPNPKTNINFFSKLFKNDKKIHKTEYDSVEQQLFALIWRELSLSRSLEEINTKVRVKPRKGEKYTTLG